VGIGKTHFPDNSDKAVRGDDRVCRFNAVNASFIDGEGIETVGGISADYRGRFKVIVRVGFFKAKELAELFVFALCLFIVDEFVICVPEFFLKFPNTEIVLLCVCKTVEKIGHGICDCGAYF
jgi:hypothetical protein